jgi:hypothetical protein
MEQDARDVLRALVEWSEGQDNPNIGTWQVSGAELQAKLSMPPNRINDAVDLLLMQQHVGQSRTFGTSPYNFSEVWPETLGKLEYQRATEMPEQAVPEQGAGTFEVFLSHSSLDDALAADVKQLLETSGIRTFSTPSSIPTGAWEPQIEQALQTSSSIWILLTPNALRESVWTHHEFGYFYGFNHGKGADPKGHRCRFLYTIGAELKGLYAWIQGTSIDSFEDPIQVATMIATDSGKELLVPVGWSRRPYPRQSGTPIIHPKMGPVSISQTGGSHGSGTSQVTIKITLIDETMHRVAALTTHPDVDLTNVTGPDIIAPSYPGSIMLRLQYRESQTADLPKELTDIQGRIFGVISGPKAPEGKAPLLITFETEDGRALAAVFYYTINRHSKGFPEFNLNPSIPVEWRQGVMPLG